MKKIKFFAIALIASVLLIGGAKAAGITNDVTRLIDENSTPTSIQNYNGVKKDSKIPSEYNFVLYRSSSQPAVNTITGRKAPTTSEVNTWISRVWGNSSAEIQEERRQDYQNTATVADESIKGKYSVRFANAGIYNDTLVDVKETVMDFEAQDVSGYTPIIKLSNRWIGNDVLGIKWVKIKYEFFKAGTNEPISVKGNTSYYDVDGTQGILLDNANKGIYATSSSRLSAAKINSNDFIYAHGLGNDTTNSVEYAFSETFEGSSMERTFSYIERDTTGIYNGGMYHTAEPVSASELPKPAKKVNKSKVNLGEEFTYTITQKIPAQLPQHYFKSYRIEDTLESPLEVSQSNISIKNGNTDVTNKFNITVNGQKINIVAKDTSTADFYGKTYTITIKTKIKSDADLTRYKSGDEYIIPNFATAYYKDHTNPTEETQIKTEIVNVTYRNYKLIVHHYLEGTTTKLASDELYKKEYNESYQTNRSSSISNEYELVATPDNAKGTIKGDTEVIYYYRKKSGLIVNVPKTAAAISTFALIFSIAAIAGSCIALYLLVYKKKSKN